MIFFCYFLITSSAARENIPLILHYTPQILIVKVSNYNCSTFTKRLSIITKENLNASYYIYSIHHFSLSIAIQILSNRGILWIPNLSVLTSRPGTE
jgi:hypothetical protein